MPTSPSAPREELGSPPPASRSPTPSPDDALTLRALVSTKDAGVIIGKGGKNVGELREQTGVKAGVSKVIPGVHERVLSITGSVEHVAQAYSFVITQLLKSAASSPNASTNPPTTSLRLLVSHNLMGSIIGRNGAKIKSIQDNSGARMVASKDMLPQSTERVVEIQGSADNIEKAIVDIGKALIEDWERGTGTVLYHPGTVEERAANTGRKQASSLSSSGGGRRVPNGEAAQSRDSPSPVANGAPLRTQNISIPSDMVGCIIGRGGTKITEIRRLSGAKISIAKTPHDETGERMFTIVGTPEANEKALFLLYNQLENEKERRVGKDQQAAQAE